MSWSLGEIENLARKAARGAGFEWGAAEEAGKAVRWLSAKGLPGMESLAALLLQIDNKSWPARCPNPSDLVWTASGEALCPVAAGITLCDHLQFWTDRKDLALGPTFQPLLLAPFVAWSQQQPSSSDQLTLEWSKVIITLEAGKARTNDPQHSDLMLSKADSVRISKGIKASSHLSQRSRAQPSSASEKTLLTFAHRTYAPETPESRLAGAGAGLNDND